MSDVQQNLPNDLPRRSSPRPRYQYRRVTTGRGTYLLLVLSCLLTAATMALGIAYLDARARLAEQAERLAVLADADDTAEARAAELLRLRRMVDDLTTIDEQQRETIGHLDQLHATLRRELIATQAELAAVGAERDAARQVALALNTGTRDQAVLAGGIAAERAALDAKLVVLEARLASAMGERDLALRAEKGMQSRVAMLETKLRDLRSSMTEETTRLRQWVVGHVNALEGVLESSGVDVDRLKRRVGKQLSAGQGGPFIPALLKDAKPPAIASQPGLTDDLSRLRAVTRLLASVPLAAPMTSYRLTSGFGTRRDPFSGRAATHEGQDFGGPHGAKVLATAPGRVVGAGRAGDYGLMVEIDHGLGIRTRYAHLSEALVRVGDRVTFRQPVGIMGSTGRSTGRHLHYEIRLDGRPLDPANFLEAGRHLKHVLKG